MQALEAVEVLEHRLHSLVHGFFVGRSGGNQGGAHTKGFGVVIVAAVQAAGDDGLGVVGTLADQLINFRAGYRYQVGVNGGGGFLDRAVRVTDDVNHGVNVVVAQGRSLLGGAQLGGQCQIIDSPAQRAHHHIHGVTLARTRVTDIDALALEVSDACNVGVFTCNHGQRLTVQCKHGAHVAECAIGFKALNAFIGLVLDVRLHNTHVHLAAANGVDVGHGAAAGGRVAANAVICAVAVEQPADRLTDNVINAGLATGADGHEGFCGDWRGAEGSVSDGG